jgi:hypothetical protein
MRHYWRHEKYARNARWRRYRDEQAWGYPQAGWYGQNLPPGLAKRSYGWGW